MDNDRLIRSINTFQTLCSFLDNDNWKYTKDEENLIIETGAKGDDLPMHMRIEVIPKSQRVRVLSILPFKIPEDKRVEGAVAIAAVNDQLINGAFDYNVQTGVIIFKMSNSFLESDINEELFKYMVIVSFNTIDDYNDKLLMLSKGLIDLNRFLGEIAIED